MIRALTDVDPYSCRVSVYRNLRSKCWSIKTAEKVADIRAGKVIAHADECWLTAAEFEVNTRSWSAYFHGTGKRGRKRNVFAHVSGKLADAPQVVSDPRRVTFHPAERGEFFDAESGETVTHADTVIFGTDGCCYADTGVVKLFGSLAG